MDDYELLKPYHDLRHKRMILNAKMNKCVKGSDEYFELLQQRNAVKQQMWEYRIMLRKEYGIRM